MTCTYGYSHFRHFQNCCNRDGNTFFKYMNYVPIVVATDLEVHFSVLKKGVSQYICLYSVCTSHWCLVMSFWLKVCIYSHTRGVKLGLGLGFSLNYLYTNWSFGSGSAHHSLNCVCVSMACWPDWEKVCVCVCVREKWDERSLEERKLRVS